MTKKTRSYKTNVNEVFQKVKEICEREGLSIAEEDVINRSLKAVTGWSAFSWGETMDIIVSQQAEGSTVTVDSKPNVWFNLPAERRAERNIESLFEELEKRMKEVANKKLGKSRFI